MAKQAGISLLTQSELKYYGIKADAGATDMWTPVRRLDGQTGDWVELADTVHPRYTSHMDNFGVPSWGVNHDGA